MTKSASTLGGGELGYDREVLASTGGKKTGPPNIGVSVNRWAFRYSGEQIAGPFYSRRDVRAGSVECFLQQLPGSLEPRRDVRAGSIERSFCYVEGALVRLTEVWRSRALPRPWPR